ncbi:hypothetical protein X743_31685 [Mesorhizobium sp. LNHC252B00]|uniref:hypothetical protein n=1 Tax=Mesorhizobium sp. LNHC252B00 TaxID=1287252 RepID=UPI0003CEB5E8|nr:hypothetical protein [Mesorhizobium sp. LNHC252B00]ESY64273.1 hypothetical protein X743_31685 [Mesorhizobium sp. LNHC252B00]
MDFSRVKRITFGKVDVGRVKPLFSRTTPVVSRHWMTRRLACLHMAGKINAGLVLRLAYANPGMSRLADGQ